jgi:hypothetical protein
MDFADDLIDGFEEEALSIVKSLCFRRLETIEVF